MDAFREPCPARIVIDCGGAFAMGAIGGSLWHAFRGFKEGARGRRLASSIDSIRLRGPVTGGSFAVWGCLYSMFDCTFSYLRGREDPWNSIGAGAATGGVLAIRNGYGPAIRAAAIGGVFLALIEGVMFALTRQAPPNYASYVPPEDEALDLGEDQSWLGRLKSWTSTKSTEEREVKLPTMETEDSDLSPHHHHTFGTTHSHDHDHDHDHDHHIPDHQHMTTSTPHTTLPTSHHDWRSDEDEFTFGGGDDYGSEDEYEDDYEFEDGEE